MPIYQYECPTCNKEIEIVTMLYDDHTPFCEGDSKTIHDRMAMCKLMSAPQKGKVEGGTPRFHI